MALSPDIVPPDPDDPHQQPPLTRAPGNPFGLPEAAIGLVAGFLLASLAVSAYHGLSGGHPTQIGDDAVGFIGLWAGFVGAAIFATRTHAPGAAGTQAHGSGSLLVDYGVRIKPWPDVPLGIAVGVGAQYILVPVLDLALQPFVHHLSQRIGQPAQNLLQPVSGVSLALLTFLVCVGSPVVEELFFRGLLLRGLLGRLGQLGPWWGPVASVVLTGIVFGLVHFEELQFLGLTGFGILLSYIAYRTGRIGVGIIAHIAFNTTTVISFVVSH